jgi:hypothetical protein
LIVSVDNCAAPDPETEKRSQLVRPDMIQKWPPRSDALKSYSILFGLLSVALCRETALREEKEFVTWMRNTNHLYTGDEYQFRLEIYRPSARLVQEHNRAGHSFTLGLNHLATLTPSE